MACTPFPVAMVLALALAGCQSSPGSFDREAGAAGPAFGLATRSNALVSRGGAPLVSLQARFAAEAPSVVTFPFDSAALDARALAAVAAQAHWMRQFPELGFRVHGHADQVGPDPYNEALGRRRAEAVVAALAARGVGRHRLEALVSFGERLPIVPVPGPERLNRRAVTEVSGFVARHPTVLNGRYAEVVFREYVASAVPPSGLEATEPVVE